MFFISTLIAIVILAFLQRSIARWVLPGHIDFDTYHHLFLADVIRCQGYDDLVLKDRAVRPFNFNYPFFVHWLLSKFPRHSWLFIERWSGPIIDACFTGVVFLLVYLLQKNIITASLVALIYIFTPAFFTIQSTGPRIKNLTPRLFGEVIGGIAFIVFSFYIANGSIILLFCASLLTAVSVVSSTFTFQAVILLSIAASIVSLNLKFMLLPILGMLLALLIFRQSFIKIFVSRLSFFKYYFLINLKGRSGVSNRNNWISLFQNIKSGDITGIYKEFFYQNSFLIVLLKYPAYVIATVIVVAEKFSLLSFGIVGMSGLLDLSTVMVFSGVLIYMLINIKYFLSLGEAERYLNYLFFFFIIILSSYIHFYLISLVLIVYGVLFQLLDLVYMYKHKNIDKNKRCEDKIIKWLNSNHDVKNIMTVPFHLAGGWRILYETQHNWLYSLGWSDAGEKHLFGSKYIQKYPYIDLKYLGEIIDRYNIDIIIVNKNAIATVKQCSTILSSFEEIDIDQSVGVFRK